VNDRQLGERLRRAFEAEQPPAISAAEILQRAEATQSERHQADVQDREPTRTHVGQPTLGPTGGQRTLGAVALDRAERQQRKLAEIRRAFAEIGSRMGSLLEPAKRSADRRPRPEAAGPSEPAVEAAPARRQGAHWALAAAVLALVCLLVGGGLGYLLPRPAGVSTQPPATIVVTHTAPATKAVTPPASCLQAAQRADVLIDLLVRKARGIEVTRALKEYSVASRTCREEASP
jgi:hypothetical protein